MDAIARFRHCLGRDGTRLAYTVDGAGAPLIAKVGQWLGDLALEPLDPVLGHWIAELVYANAVLRYDPRGYGRSERSPARISLDDWVDDLGSVLQAAGSREVVLFAVSQAAPVAIRFAARHPEHVRGLVLWGATGRGARRLGADGAATRALDARVALARDGWNDPATFRTLFASWLLPGADADALEAYERSHRPLATGDVTARTLAAHLGVDVLDDARRIACPTWLVHAIDDPVAPAAEVARLADAIPGAQRIAVPGSRHLPTVDDPGWPPARAALRGILDGIAARHAAATPRLSARQAEVLALIAHGLTDREIGERLGLSPRTVEVHVASARRQLRARSRDDAVRAAAAWRLLG